MKPRSTSHAKHNVRVSSSKLTPRCDRYRPTPENAVSAIKATPSNAAT